jgi:polar amino acid transport system substrate-binding protein
MSPFRNSVFRGPHLFAIAAMILLALATAASADDSLAMIKRTGTTTVGTEAAFPPFEMVKDGKIVGYGKDILDYVIAGLPGVKLNQLDVPYDGLFPGLIAGKFDFIATTLLISDADTKKFAFTYPFAEGSSSIMKRKSDARIKSVQDLNGMAVGAQIGTGSVVTLRALDAKLKSEGKPGIELKLFNSGPEGVLALANKQIDAVVSLLPTLRALANKQPDLYEVVGLIQPDKREFLGWAARAEDKPLRDYISGKIRELRDSGKLYEWQEKWFGFRMELPDSGYLPEGAI